MPAASTRVASPASGSDTQLIGVVKPGSFWHALIFAATALAVQSAASTTNCRAAGAAGV